MNKIQNYVLYLIPIKKIGSIHNFADAMYKTHHRDFILINEIPFVFIHAYIIEASSGSKT